MADRVALTSEPTIFGSVWRYKWLVLLLAIAFAGLGWLYASQTSEWTATATLSVQDPRASNVVFDQGGGDAPERYVEAQVAILQSRSVAKRAVEILADSSPPVDVTVTQVVEGLSVRATDASDIVRLTFSAPTEGEAIAVVNAVAVAYQEIGRASADTSFTNAVAELDRSIEELRTEIDSIEETLAERQVAVLDALAADEQRIALNEQLDALTAELLELEPPPASASLERQAQFDNQITSLTVRINQISADLDEQRNLALAAEAANPTRASLERIQTESEARLIDLQSRRDQLAVDADLASNGVVFYSPAEVAVPSSAGLYVVLGFLFGLTIGSALAVWLSSRSQRFSSRSEPELVLDARLLADVPNFREERVESKLPVIDAPASASAEAFRFVSASILLQQQWPAREDGGTNFGSVVTLSAGVFEGKTVVTANTALAAAREGHRVLVVDADFGNQQLTALLLGDSVPQLGMTELITSDYHLGEVAVDIPVDGSGSLHLLSRGSVVMGGPDFFASDATARLFGLLSRQYDLVLIDSPPLLRVAYATTLARLADRAMVVVAHGESTQNVQELKNQMELVGIPPVGYVYNFAPLRSEMLVSAGSMADTIGDQPANTHRLSVRPEQ